MRSPDWPRRQIDLQAYAQAVRSAPCFICDISAGGPRRDQHHVIYEDADHIVFLNRFPTVPGYVLLAPREHRINVTGDFTVEEYLATQRLLHSVAEAVRTELGAERIYILSLGSHQGNAHVHWHVAPLPLGTSYDKQQFEALRAENGILCIPEEEMKELADRLRLRLAGCT